MTAADFEAFPSIPRLKRGCVITEKIDGTNAQVFIGPDGEVMAGSRNRWLIEGHDNHGFWRWVQDNRDELLRLGPGRHFGEWWGSGIQRRYGIAEKRFSLFNTRRWAVDFADQKPACCHVVPILYSGDFSTTVVDDALAHLRVTGSVAAPGFSNPEGIVVYLPAAHTMFKVTLGDDGHKGQRVQEEAASP